MKDMYRAWFDENKHNFFFRESKWQKPPRREGRVIWKWILEKLFRGVWLVLIWLSAEASGRLCPIRQGIS